MSSTILLKHLECHLYPHWLLPLADKSGWIWFCSKCRASGPEVQWSVLQAFSQLCTLISLFCSLGQILPFLLYLTKLISYLSPLKSKAKQDLGKLIFPHFSRWVLLETTAQVDMFSSKKLQVIPSECLWWRIGRKHGRIYVYRHRI